jgi:hypothetical protein
MVTPSPADESCGWCRDVAAAEQLLSRAETEIETNASVICQTVEMGENLMREIQSETDYPPGYLVRFSMPSLVPKPTAG